MEQLTLEKITEHVVQILNEKKLISFSICQDTEEIHIPNSYFKSFIPRENPYIVIEFKNADGPKFNNATL